MNPFCNAVSPGYFKTMGIPLVAGRDFDDRDARTSRRPRTEHGRRTITVAIVNESYAKQYFGERRSDRPAHRLRQEPRDEDADRDRRRREGCEVHGRARRDPAQVFFPFMENDFAGGAVMYVRTVEPAGCGVRGDPRRCCGSSTPNVPMYSLRTMESQIDQSLLNERLVATLSTAFGVLATLLAVIGLYGVMAYTVARRTREIGVRMALGAVHGDVVWLVMREVLVLVGSGIVHRPGRAHGA